MEEAYQRYKGRVNFAHIYVEEAHPEERPFEAGYETKDLGNVWAVIIKTISNR